MGGNLGPCPKCGGGVSPAERAYGIHFPCGYDLAHAPDDQALAMKKVWDDSLARLSAIRAEKAEHPSAEWAYADIDEALTAYGEYLSSRELVASDITWIRAFAIDAMQTVPDRLHRLRELPGLVKPMVWPPSAADPAASHSGLLSQLDAYEPVWGVQIAPGLCCRCHGERHGYPNTWLQWVDFGGRPCVRCQGKGQV
jgi:hypothetical protein